MATTRLLLFFGRRTVARTRSIIGAYWRTAALRSHTTKQPGAQRQSAAAGSAVCRPWLIVVKARAEGVARVGRHGLGQGIGRRLGPCDGRRQQVEEGIARSVGGRLQRRARLRFAQGGAVVVSGRWCGAREQSIIGVAPVHRGGVLEAGLQRVDPAARCGGTARSTACGPCLRIRGRAVATVRCRSGGVGGMCAAHDEGVGRTGVHDGVGPVWLRQQQCAVWRSCKTRPIWDFAMLFFSTRGFAHDRTAGVWVWVQSVCHCDLTATRV